MIELPPPAAGKRTTIVLPGSTGANETAGQTEAPSPAGTPPSSGSSLSETAVQTQAPSSGEPVVRASKLSQADPQRLAGQLSQLFPDTSRTDTGPGFGMRFGDGGPFGGSFRGNDQATSNTKDKKPSQVVIVPEPRTGSLTVSAPHQLMPPIAEAINTLDAKHEPVRVFDLANADSQDTKQILQDLFERSGNIRANNNNNRNSMLGAGNPLTARETQNQTSPSSPSAGLGNNLAGGSGGGGMLGGGGGMGGGMMGGGIGGGMGGGMMDGGMVARSRAAYVARYGEPAGGGMGGGMMGGRGGGTGGAPGDKSSGFILGTTAPIESSRPLMNGSARQAGALGGAAPPGPILSASGLSSLESSVGPQEAPKLAKPVAGPGERAQAVDSLETLKRGKPAAQPAQGGSTAGPVATAATPLQDQIPILGDKPLIGKLYRDEAAESAAAEVELKTQNSTRNLGWLASGVKGLPAQDQPVAGVAQAGGVTNLGRAGVSALSEAVAAQGARVGGGGKAQAAGDLALGVNVRPNVNFSIDPESRRVVTIADEEASRAMSQVVTNFGQPDVANDEKGPAASAFGGRYAYIVPSAGDDGRKLKELKEAAKLSGGGIEAPDGARKGEGQQLAQAQAEAERLSQPGAYARTNLIFTGRGRSIIASKLDRIRLDEAQSAGAPLTEVLKQVAEEARRRDPDGRGVNFVFNGNIDGSTGGLAVDPATGLPVSTQTNGMTLRTGLSLTDVRLADALDAIVKVADKPIKYSIEDYGVVFSPAGAEAKPRTEPDEPKPRPAAPAPVPEPEVQTRENAFSTFSLNVSDVSFKLAAASLEKGLMPEPATVRSEEFINAFDYRDPEAPAGVPVAFAWERARYPFAQNRDLLRFSLKTAAQGRQAGRPLNVVLLLDTSGSMERADRVRIIHEALRVLAGQLQAQDQLSVVTFARTARLWVDGVPGSQAGQVAEAVSGLTPQGGTNLEEAMNLAYQTALRHYLADGINRVVLLTDGAANLGNVEPEALKQKVEAHRKQGVALDCFGIGWEGYNDDLLEVLSRNGDGRYGFLNTPEEAASEFAGQLAGALRVAASDVKVQVEFNPARVRAYRQIGYAKHQLAKEQFRDNTVVAAQIGAAESGNALYIIETDPRGDGPLGVVRVRYRVPGTSDYREQEWTAPYTGNAGPLEQAGAALRLAATAGAFSEWLASSPFAGEVTPERLLGCLRGVPEVYGPDGRPRKLESMIRQAQSLGGK